jgi:hypothetical protein
MHARRNTSYCISIVLLHTITQLSYSDEMSDGTERHWHSEEAKI